MLMCPAILSQSLSTNPLGCHGILDLFHFQFLSFISSSLEHRSWFRTFVSCCYCQVRELTPFSKLEPFSGVFGQHWSYGWNPGKRDFTKGARHLAPMRRNYGPVDLPNRQSDYYYG